MDSRGKRENDGDVKSPSITRRLCRRSIKILLCGRIGGARLYAAHIAFARQRRRWYVAIRPRPSARKHLRAFCGINRKVGFVVVCVFHWLLFLCCFARRKLQQASITIPQKPPIFQIPVISALFFVIPAIFPSFSRPKGAGIQHTNAAACGGKGAKAPSF